jgi:hypothetical protein
MSELHQPYTEIIAMPMIELHKIVLGLMEIRKNHEVKDGLDCDLVDDDDYNEWFKHE